MTLVRIILYAAWIALALYAGVRLWQQVERMPIGVHAEAR